MSPNVWSARIAAALEDRRALSRYRERLTVSSAASAEQRVEGSNLLNFCSNDYLGLANHPALKQALNAAVDKYGVGSGASHLVSGHSEVHHLLEERIARWTGRDRALAFSSGYMANTGIINALAKAGDSVLQDRLNHASLLDGGLISAANLKRYRHSDTAHLCQLLAKSEGKPSLVVSDGVFSMDGDIAPLKDLAAICAERDALLMVDDAHGFGCLGETGAGSAEICGLSQEALPILVGTFGKAFGTFGAFVAGSHSMIEYLIQFARNYIFTTALPSAVAAATLASLDLIQQGGNLREQLKTNIQYFRALSEAEGLPLSSSQTAIQPIILGADQRAVQVSQFLFDSGIWVSAIRPPTVAQGTARLRVTLSAGHTKEHIERLVAVLTKALKQYPAS